MVSRVRSPARLRNFFGKDDVTFTVTTDSPTATQKSRSYNKLSDLPTISSMSVSTKAFTSVSLT